MERSSGQLTERPLLKKVPVWLMVLLSIFSLGFYMGFWILNRREDIKEMKSVHHIPFLWWRIVTLLLVVLFFLNIFHPFFFTEFGYLHIESFDIIFTFFFIGLLYYTAFRIREVIEDVSTINYNSYLLFFFHIFYIQYKINRKVVEGSKPASILEVPRETVQSRPQ